MITDKLLRVAEDQAVTASAVSSNSIDLTQHTGIGAEIGEGHPLYMVFTVTTTFDTLTSLTFNICADTGANLATSNTVLASTGAVTLAGGGLAAGKQHILQIPPVIASLGKRYLGASFTVGGSSANNGKVTVDIVETIQDGKKYYASGFSVT
jgi:hypothetical protein